MSANNLGIVFGPTLLRLPDGPGPAGAGPITCLLDSAHQAQLIEFLIVHYEQIFGDDELLLATEPLPPHPPPPPVDPPPRLQPPHLQLVLDPLPLSLASDQDPDAMLLSALEKHPEATLPEVGTCWATDMGRAFSPCNPLTLSPVFLPSFLPL